MTVADNDGTGVTVTPSELTVEEGEEGSYTVVLNREPTAPVTVTVTAGGGLTASPASLTFTTSNWDEPQTVTVTAGEDEDASDETGTITHAVTSTDTGYSGVVVEGVRVTVADDEGTGGPGGTEELTVSTTRLRITEGNMGKYTVVLNRAPASGVTVAVSAPAGGDLTVSPATLEFTTDNWDTPQEVQVTAGQDADLADEVESITHTITRGTTSSSAAVRGGLWRDAFFATATGAPAPTREYVYLGERLVAIETGGAVSEASVVVTIDDDDDPETPGVPALTSSLTLWEGHAGAYTLELGARPTADVRIALSVSPASDNVADVSVSPTGPLTFTASNWDSPQWVTVTVAEDSDTVGETETISHAAASDDSRYQGIEIPDVRVVIRDRTRSGPAPTGTLTANPNPCIIAAGGDRCSTTLSWSAENTSAVQIRRGPDKILVRNDNPDGDPPDTLVVNDILKTPTGAYPSEFYLYDYDTSAARRGKELDSVTVTTVPAPGISPDSGPVGTEVTITGSGFGTTEGSVTFGGTSASITSWSDTRIVVEVPAGLAAGAVSVVVTVNGQSTTVGTFTVTPTGPTGTISASPNPCEIDDADDFDCAVTITWNSERTRAVQVWVSHNGNPQTAFTGTGTTSGSQTASWIQGTPHTYTFNLYNLSDGNDNPATPPDGDPLASVAVTANGDPEGFIWAKPNPCSIASGQSSCQTAIGWTSRGYSAVRVWKQEGNNDPTAFTTTDSIMGSKQATIRESTRYTFSLHDHSGGTKGKLLASVPVTGEVGLPSCTLSASPADICSGESSTLSWTTTNADSASIDRGIGAVTPVASGTEEVSPTTTTTYTLTATNSSGSATCRTTVNVWDPPTASISADRTTINEGQPFTLSWSTSNAGSASIDQGIGSVTANASGSRSLEPSEGSHTYTITASKATGSPCRDATASVTVTVRPKPRGEIEADPNPCTIEQGENDCTTALNWSATGTTGLRVEVSRDGNDPRLVSTSGSSGSASPSWIREGSSYKFSLYDYMDRVKGAFLRSVTVTGTRPTDPPTITSFTANPTSVDLGEQSTLSWTVSGATGLGIDQGVGSVSPLTSGSERVTPKEDLVTTTYTLTASNASVVDTTATASVTINEPTCEFSASSTLVDPGDEVTLSWKATSAKSVSIDQNIGAVTPVAEGSQTVRPSTRTTYTITATGSASRTASCTATVKVRPRIDTFEADPSSITRGDSSTLSWTTTNAASVTLSGHPLVSDPNSSQAVVPWAIEDHSYTLTARNGDGTDSETVTVTVSLPPAPALTSLSPTQGVPDSTVTLYGTNFSTTQGSVSFGGISAEINSWADTTVSVLVPGQLGRGQVSVSLTALGQTSNSLTFTVTGDPVREEECEEDEEDCEEEDGDEEEDDATTPDP